MMSVLPQAIRRFILCALVLCLLLPAGAMADHMEEDIHRNKETEAFSVLILGDSQMAGDGWAGGYTNCFEEHYPNARVLNLAQSGARLEDGEIFDQWEYFLKMDAQMPDYVIMDGGANDLFAMKKDGVTEEKIDKAQDDLKTLLKAIHEESPETSIIYVTMPPLQEWSDSEKGTPSYKTQQYFWKKMSFVACRCYYVTVVDFFSLNPFHFPCKQCHEEHFADSIHLNENGYRRTFNYYIDNLFMAQWTE